MSQIGGHRGAGPVVGPEGAGRTAPQRDRRREARLVLIGVAAALLVWFAVENLQTVVVHLWVGSAHVSQITVIVISVLLGALIASLAGHVRRQGRRGRKASKAQDL